MTLRPRSNSVGARPLSSIPLSSSLLKLAAEVWDKRGSIEHRDDIYDLYNGIEPTNFSTYARMHGLTGFFRGILFLGIEMNTDIFLQDFQTVPLEYLVTARENYVGMHLPIVNAVVKIRLAECAKRHGLSNEDYLVDRMSMSFFCLTANIRCSVTHRVYLNVNNSSNKDLKSSLHILNYVIREIMYKINGVDSAKITAVNRVDSMIIYTSSIDVSNKVIAKIQEYQNKNGVSGFNPEIPMMTEAQMYGVATASESPDITIINGQLLPSILRQSFGSLRADLIYDALKNATGCSDFYELIVKYFREAGVDAKQPAIHFAFNSRVWEAQRSFVDLVISAARCER